MRRTGLYHHSGLKTIDYIETKDVGRSLDEAEKTDQIKRYQDSLSNFFVSDHLEFRWFIEGKLRLKARLGTTSNGKINPSQEDVQQVNELFGSFFNIRLKAVGTPKELALRMAQPGAPDSQPDYQHL